MRQVVAMFVVFVCAGCSRQAIDDPPIPWKPPTDPTWDELPKTDEAARAVATKEASKPKLHRFDENELLTLKPETSRLVAGEAAIAQAYDGWMNGDAAKASYLVFGTMHDSRAQLEAVASIVFRMKAPWGLALEQFRASGKWRGAPAATSADDADLATLTQGSAPLDEGALWRVRDRQERFDHAAWKYGYLEAMTSLVWQARGAGMPLFGCDMPPELRTSLTSGGEAERSMRELHCARSLRATAPTVAPLHGGDAGLTDDDPMPPERFAILVGANHAEPDGLPRFLGKNGKPARFVTVRVLGGRPRDAQGEESELAPHIVVTDPVLVRSTTNGPDVLLLPDDTWGGSVDRASDTGSASRAAVGPNLPRPNVVVTSDESARFALGESSVDVGAKPEWISVRAGHQAFIAVATSRTILGAIDVPDAGYAEVHVSPKDRALRVVIHKP
jgi:hypothetical protein